MNTLKIGSNEYEIEKLPEECKNQLIGIQFAEQEIIRLQASIAALQTAKVAYAKELQNVIARLKIEPSRSVQSKQ